MEWRDGGGRAIDLSEAMPAEEEGESNRYSVQTGTTPSNVNGGRGKRKAIQAGELDLAKEGDDGIGALVSNCRGRAKDGPKTGQGRLKDDPMTGKRRAKGGYCMFDWVEETRNLFSTSGLNAWVFDPMQAERGG
jgi:hypothetical protein